MNKVQDFFKQLYEGTLYFDADTVKSLSFTPEEALELFGLIRIELKDKKNRKMWNKPQSLIFISAMSHFGVTHEMLENYVKTKL
jgi:hypothetical protein